MRGFTLPVVQSLADIAGHQTIINHLRARLLKTKLFQHLLFYGRPGVGKTSTAIAFSKEYLKEDFNKHFIELNASHERGVDFIKNQVFAFSRFTTISGRKRVVLFDEAEHLTRDAQAALRRLMEIYNDNVMYIFTTNHPDKILEAITSRCASYNFKPLSASHIHKYLQSHKIKLTDTLLKKISNGGGDLRQILNNLTTPLNSQKELQLFCDQLLTVPAGSTFIRAYGQIARHMSIHIFGKLKNAVLQQKQWSAEKKINTLFLIAEAHYAAVMTNEPGLQVFKFYKQMVDLSK